VVVVRVNVLVSVVVVRVVLLVSVVPVVVLDTVPVSVILDSVDVASVVVVAVGVIVLPVSVVVRSRHIQTLSKVVVESVKFVMLSKLCVVLSTVSWHSQDKLSSLQGLPESTSRHISGSMQSSSKTQPRVDVMVYVSEVSVVDVMVAEVVVYVGVALPQ
jgi:hypothetical protein